MKPEEWLEAEFARCKGWVQDALDSCPVKTHDVCHVWEALEAGRAQLWPKPNSVVVTTFDVHPTGLKTLCAWLAGGKLEELRQTAAFLETYARKNGCDVFTISGRSGWARALPGFKLVSTMTCKEL